MRVRIPLTTIYIVVTTMQDVQNLLDAQAELAKTTIEHGRADVFALPLSNLLDAIRRILK